MPRGGIEPPTPSSSGKRSTTELPRQFIYSKKNKILLQDFPFFINIKTKIYGGYGVMAAQQAVALLERVQIPLVSLYLVLPLHEPRA